MNARRGVRTRVGWRTPSDLRLIGFATVAGVGLTAGILGACVLVMAQSDLRARGEAAIQAEVAVGRVRDTLATLSRISTDTVPGDGGSAENCPRLRAVRSIPMLPQQVGHSATVLLGICCESDPWVQQATAALSSGAGEQSTIRQIRGEHVYQQATVLPVERCHGCHPKGAHLPAVLVEIPLRNIREAALQRDKWPFIGFGFTWLVGLGFITHTVQGFRKTARDLRRLRDDHLTFFDESPSAALLVPETEEGLLGGVLRANRRAAEDFDRPPEELVGVAVGDLVVGLDESRQRALVQALHVRGQVIIETAMLARTQRPIPVEAEFSVFEYEAVPTILVFMRDLGDRRAAEHALSRRDRRLELLSSVTRRLAELLDEKLVLRELVSSAMEIVDATAGTAGLLEGDELVFTEAASLEGREPVDIRQPASEWVVGHVLETRAPYLTNDAPRDPLVPTAIRTRAGFLNLLAVPILDSAGRALGVLEVHDQIYGPFDQEDARALMGVASSAGVAIENSRVVQQLLATREQLLVNQEELRQLAEELSAAQERERRRIAVELHDGIGQNLAIMRIRLGQASERYGSEAGGSLSELLQLLEDTIAQTRSLTSQLSPPVLYELGLGPALEWLCEKLGDEHGFDFIFTESGTTLSVGEDVRALLYAATRELVLNAVKHAEPSRVVVSVDWGADETLIEVCDDGKGLPQEGMPAGHTGVGLFGVRERLRAVGGALQLVSEPGRGTRALIEVPASAYGP